MNTDDAPTPDAAAHDTDTPALRELAAAGDLDFEVVRVEPPGSLEESAKRQRIDPADLLKTLVVRRGEGDYLFVLVPGDRGIDWPKLRAYAGVSRMSMPGAEEARDVTGYERGTITPFGASSRLPVVADATIPQKARVAIGGGAHGVNVHVSGAALVAYLGAEVEDVTKPQ